MLEAVQSATAGMLEALQPADGPSIQFHIDSAYRLAETFLSMKPEILLQGNYIGKHPINHLSKVFHHSKIQDLIIKVMRYHIVHTHNEEDSSSTTQLPFLLDDEEHEFARQIRKLLKEELLVARRLNKLKAMVVKTNGVSVAMQGQGEQGKEGLEKERSGHQAGRDFQEWMEERLGRVASFALIPEVKIIRQSIEQAKVNHQKRSEEFSRTMARQFGTRMRELNNA